LAGEHPAARSVLQAGRSRYHYKGKRSPQAVLNKRIKEIAAAVRYGYRRIRVLLRPSGLALALARVKKAGEAVDLSRREE
jgi:putative transposase